MSKKIKIAISQYPVSSNISKNLSNIKQHIKFASEEGAGLVHFCECSLSSYAGIDFPEFTEKANQQIRNGIAQICELAQLHNIWVVFGTHVFENKMEKPFNSLFVINNLGEIVKRYDKRLLAQCDMDWYTAGKEPGIFEIEGVKCGLLICHEWRYPELYRQYYKLGVQLLFQSWYDGNLSQEEYKKEGKNLGEVIPGFVRGNAANNKLWVSGANTCKKQQSFPVFLVRPDGSVKGKLNRNKTGVLISEIDLDKKYLDLSCHLRDKVIDSNFRYNSQ